MCVDEGAVFVGSPHIIIVGFMAAGKTTVGRLLAAVMDRPFYDCDEAIEKRTGKTVPALFAAEGEAAFRRYEQEALEALLRKSEPAVISCGGGIVTHEPSRQLLAREETVVWLDIAISVAYKRIKRQKGRPLRENQTLASMEALAQKRRPDYASVGRYVIRLDQEETTKTIVDRILQSLKE